MSDYMERIGAMLEQLPDWLVSDREKNDGWYNLRDNSGSFWLDIKETPGAVDDWADRLALALTAVASYSKDVRELVSEYKALQGRLSYMAAEKELAEWNTSWLRTRVKELEVLSGKAFCNLTSMEIVEVMRRRGWDAEYDDQYEEIHVKLPWTEGEVDENE